MNRFKKLLIQSFKEFKKYQKNKNDIHLAKAGEKLWNAYQELLMKKLKTNIRSFKQYREAVSEAYAKTGIRQYIELFEDLYDLHKYFYRGYAEDIKEVEKKYLNSYLTLKSLSKIEVD